MRLRQLILCVLSLGAGPGCHTLYQDRTVAVVVRDAETNAVIRDAEVRVSDPADHQARVVAGTPAEDGATRLRVNPSAEVALSVEVSATGYFAEEKDLPVETLREAPPRGFFGGTDGTPMLVVVEMYAYPRPTVELVVPAGYRGVIKAEVRASKGGGPAPGERAFSYTVPPNGVVQLPGGGIMRYALPSDFRARYADGTPLKPDAKDDEVGLRWVKSESGEAVFVVGTKSEWDGVRKSMEKDAPRGKPSGGSCGQQGRGGHRGGRGGGMGGGGMGGR